MINKKEITTRIGTKKNLYIGNLTDLVNNFKIDHNNFFNCTIANWKTTNNKINFRSNYTSNSGSQYMYTEEGVYRKSNHWSGSIASCIWLLNGTESESETIAFCKWSDFTKFGFKNKAHAGMYRLNQCIEYYKIQDNINNFLNGTFGCKNYINTVFNLI